MKSALKILIFPVLFFQVAFSLSADESIREQIINAQDLYYNNSIDQADIKLSSLSAELTPYWMARRLYLNGLVTLRRGDKNGARSLFEELERVASEELASVNPAEGLAFVSEARSRLMLLNSIAYKIGNASRTQKIAESALREDPDNVLARLVLARGKINAPRIFGGDVEYGIQTLEGMLENSGDSLEKAERFKALYAISQAWLKKKEYSEAARYAKSALLLYPANPEALEIQRKIEARLR